MLGTPLGHRDFVEAQVSQTGEVHSVLLRRISAVPDLQCVWLILLASGEGHLLVEGGASLLVSRFRDHPRQCCVELFVRTLGHCGNTADERQSKHFLVQRGLRHLQRDQRQGQRLLG